MQPNCYKVCFLRAGDENLVHRIFHHHDMSDCGSPLMVNLSSDLEGTPPPDRKLLALHAMCARVAHMSGAAKFLYKLELDAEDMAVLASNGS